MVVGGICQDVTSTSTTWHQHPVRGATPWAEPGLWACRRGSLEVTCSQDSGPDPAPSSFTPEQCLSQAGTSSTAPLLLWRPGWNRLLRHDPPHCMGTPRARVRAWDPHSACLALSLGGQLRAEPAACSQQGAGGGLASLRSAESNSKIAGRLPLEEKKKGVSENLFSQVGFPGKGHRCRGWTASHSAVVLSPYQVGRQRLGAEWIWHPRGSAFEAVQLLMAGPASLALLKGANVF